MGHVQARSPAERTRRGLRIAASKRLESLALDLEHSHKHIILVGENLDTGESIRLHVTGAFIVNENGDYYDNTLEDDTEVLPNG